MSERSISLHELLNLSIGPPRMSSVNFGALHALLLAVLKELGIQEQTSPWRDSSPRSKAEEFSAQTQEEEEEEEGDSHLQRHGWEARAGLPSSIQSLEDGVSEAMALIQELRTQKEELRTQVEALQQQMDGGEAEELRKCCHRVEALEEDLKSLRGAFQSFPDQEQMSHVTRDAMQSVLLSDRGHLQQMVGGEAEELKKCCHRVEALEEDLKSLRGAFQSFPDQEQMSRVTRDAMQTVLLSDRGHLQQSGTGADAAEASRTVGLQQEKFNELEARVAALEEDQTQLAELRELLADRGNPEQLMEELNQQRALIESLMSEQEKLEHLEEGAFEEASDGVDADGGALRELKLQVSHLRKCVHQLEEDMKLLRDRQDQCEETAAEQNLQEQLDDLQAMLEDFILSLTSHLSGSLQDDAGPDRTQSQESNQSAKRSAFTAKTVKVCRELRLLFQRYEHLQESVKMLMGGGGAPPRDRDPDRVDPEGGQLNDVQRSVLHLQADCEKLQEATALLHDDSRRKHERIEELFKMTEELSVRKADKQMVEDEIEADKTALENKVSRLQFDATMEQLNAMFHELLNKVTDQEQDWHSVMDKLSSEMDCKLNRMELDSMKKQLEDRWRNIFKTLQAQEAPEADDAAALRKQLVERFHCLSCDRPVLKRFPSAAMVTLPSFSPFPSRKSRRIHPAEALRQQYRSERIPELVEYGRMLMSRNCGGSHTSTSTLPRRSCPPHAKLHGLAEADGAGQSEVDIIGEDGRLYRGRLDLRSPDSKLPTIAPKDGAHRTKDRAKSSASLRPVPSPEGGQTSPVEQPAHSARSPQFSRSASSCSGRDWPVSALGCCTPQSSITQASAAVSSLDPRGGSAPLNL
ncbi:glutamine-rich protein 2 isoform X5 [Oryzias latipes]